MAITEFFFRLAIFLMVVFAGWSHAEVYEADITFTQAGEITFTEEVVGDATTWPPKNGDIPTYRGGDTIAWEPDGNIIIDDSAILWPPQAARINIGDFTITAEDNKLIIEYIGSSRAKKALQKALKYLEDKDADIEYIKKILEEIN